MTTDLPLTIKKYNNTRYEIYFGQIYIGGKKKWQYIIFRVKTSR